MVRSRSSGPCRCPFRHPAERGGGTVPPPKRIGRTHPSSLPGHASPAHSEPARDSRERQRPDIAIRSPFLPPRYPFAGDCPPRIQQTRRFEKTGRSQLCEAPAAGPGAEVALAAKMDYNREKRVRPKAAPSGGSRGRRLVPARQSLWAALVETYMPLAWREQTEFEPFVAADPKYAEGWELPSTFRFRFDASRETSDEPPTEERVVRQ